jgi:hypothetical protein
MIKLIVRRTPMVTCMALAWMIHCPKPNPPAPCDPASSCVSISLTSTGVCNKHLNSITLSDNREPKAHNGNATRDIWATFARTATHYDQPGNETDTSFVSFLLPHSGDVSIGCEYDNGQTQGYDKFAYSVASACFTDAPNCKPTVLLTSVSHDCRSNCNPPYCIVQALGSATPEEAAAAAQVKAASNAFVAANYSGAPDLSSLFGSACTNRKTNVKHVNSGLDDIEDSGDSCTFPLPLQNIPGISGVLVTIGSDVLGIRSLDPKSTSLSLRYIQPELQSDGISLEYFDDKNQSMGFEHISRIEFFSNQIRFMGNRRYCIWLNIEGRAAKGKK